MREINLESETTKAQDEQNRAFDNHIRKTMQSAMNKCKPLTNSEELAKNVVNKSKNHDK